MNEVLNLLINGWLICVLIVAIIVFVAAAWWLITLLITDQWKEL